MPKRNVKEKTEYQKQVASYRSACDRHVVQFEADMTEDQKRKAFALANDLRLAGNEVVAEMNRRLDQLRRRKTYRRLLAEYGKCSDALKKLDPESKQYTERRKEQKELGRKLNAMQESFGVTKHEVVALMAEQAKKYGFHSVFGLSRADSIWSALSTVLYGDGKTLHFKKRGDLPAIQAKQINRGIPVALSKDGKLSFSTKGIGSFRIKEGCMDRFQKDEYDAIVSYLKNPGQEADAVRKYAESKNLIQTPRPCFVSLVCETIRGKIRVFIQITVACRACEKFGRDGKPRHVYGKGRVGIDLGTQSVAITTDNETELWNLAERDNKSTRQNEQVKARLRRKMERSKRLNNPDRYNEDGTYKKGSKGKWVFSKRYRRYRERLREMERRDADSRKFAVREMANRIRALADVCIIEPPNASKLQRRSKKTERQEQESVVETKSGETKTIRKHKRKKRFGKSIHHRCPGALQAELKKKFQDQYHEVPTLYRASQYDHKEDTCTKKKLNDRWHTFKDGDAVQRDSYSSFLLYCANDAFEEIDKEKCDRYFETYHKHHDEMLNTIRKTGVQICNSGIKVQPSKGKTRRQHL